MLDCINKWEEVFCIPKAWPNVFEIVVLNVYVNAILVYHSVDNDRTERKNNLYKLNMCKLFDKQTGK